MKKFRKIMAVLVAAMMIMAMTVPAWAATANYTLKANYDADPAISDQTVSDSETVPTNQFSRDGYVFIGWAESATGTTLIQPGTPSDGSKTLYAQWREIASGRLGSKHAAITIDNPKEGETYSAYKIFDLASFKDEDPATSAHTGIEDQGTATEWYSYVVSEKLLNDSDNPWWDFLTKTPGSGEYATYGRKINGELVPWAVSDAVHEPLTNAEKLAIFYYSDKTVTLKGNDNNEHVYHIIYANPNLVSSGGSFSNDSDDPETDNTSRDDVGVSAGIDYVTASRNTDNLDNKLIQDFAQQALNFARTNSTIMGWDSGADDGKYVHTAKDSDERYDTTTKELFLVADNYVAANPTATPPVAESGWADNAALGYYVIGSTMGTLASLDTTNCHIVKHEKNDEPKIEKAVKVKEASPYVGYDVATDKYTSATYTDADNWVKNTDADLQDKIQFRTIITVEQGMKNYVLHDVMEKGLTFLDVYANPYPAEGDAVIEGYRVYLERDTVNSSTGVTTTDFYFLPETITAGSYTGIASELPAGANYVLKSAANNEITPADGCDFEIAFQDANNTLPEYLDQQNLLGTADGTNWTMLDVKDGDRLVVYYYATLNENAAIFGNAEVAGLKEDDVPTSGAATTTIQDNKGDDTELPSTHQVNYKSNTNQRNDNYTVMTYGDRSYTTLETASVTTYQFDVVKTRNDEHGATPWNLLDGATFKLYKVTTTASDAIDKDEAAADKKVWEVSNGTTNVSYYPLSKGLVFDAANAPVYQYSGDAVTTTNGASNTVASGLTGTSLLSTDSAAINVYGLEAGTYLLEETVAPLGYHKLAKPIIITINGDTNNDGVFEGVYTNAEAAEASDPSLEGTPKDGKFEGSISWDLQKNNGEVEHEPDTTTGAGAKANITSSGGKAYFDDSQSVNVAGSTIPRKLLGLQVINETSEELPSTGGMGTTVLYIVGGMMVLLAGAYLFFSRKRTA